MRTIRRHIVRSFGLFLLVAAGLGFTQVHDLVHYAEDVYQSSDHHHGDLPDENSDHQDCLNCILVFASADFSHTCSSPDYSVDKLESKTALPFVSAAPSYQFLLRAPPAG